MPYVDIDSDLKFIEQHKKQDTYFQRHIDEFLRNLPIEEKSYIACQLTGPRIYSTIIDFLIRHARSQPDKEFIVLFDSNRQRLNITYGELYEKSRRFASVLWNMGVRKGDVVVVLLVNSIEWAVVNFGIIMTGAIPLSMYFVSKDFKDMQYTLKKTSPVAMVHSTVLLGHQLEMSDFIRMLDSEEAATIRHVICVNTPEDQPPIKSFQKLMESSDECFDHNLVSLDPDDTAMIMRSSGTTGVAKLIVHTHSNLINIFKSSSDEQQTVFNICAFGWIAGTPIRDIVNGWTRVTTLVMAETSDEAILFYMNCMQQEKCTSTVLDPSIGAKLAKMNPQPKYPETLTMIILSGAAIEQYAEALLDKVRKLTASYAMLEAGALCGKIFSSGMKIERCVGGTPIPGIEIKVTNQDYDIVPRGVTGRILTRTPNIFVEYYGDEAQSRSVKISGWYDTQDVGYITREGELFVLGRDGEALTTDNATLQLSEIENCLLQLDIPGVCDIMATTVQDDIHGELLCACVVVDGSAADCKDILKEMNDRILLGYYRPKFLWVVDNIPRNMNGKVVRKSLAKEVRENRNKLIAL